MYQISSFDDLSPYLVNLSKPTSFLWHLSHDVRGGEDWFQIQPGSLHLQPLIKNLLHIEQFRLPVPEEGREKNKRREEKEEKEDEKEEEEEKTHCAL